MASFSTLLHASSLSAMWASCLQHRVEEGENEEIILTLYFQILVDCICTLVTLWAIKVCLAKY